nr:D-ribitol-5-phosphate cytidylyltransferase [uncultured Prevotella sp.]
MNHAIILAGGTGQRMRSSGMPKQFLKVYGKPIIIYTLEKFVTCKEVDSIVVVCNPQYIDYMEELVNTYGYSNVNVVSGGKDRQGSVQSGIDCLSFKGAKEDDLVIIHDGVRPLIDQMTILENIKMAQKYGCAMTVKPVIESVVITEKNVADFADFMKRDDTYSLTSPQTFRLQLLIDTYNKIQDLATPIPILDAALAYTYLGNNIPLVKEYNHNIKITTPEDYYILKAILELQENKNVFGLI